MHHSKTAACMMPPLFRRSHWNGLGPDLSEPFVRKVIAAFSRTPRPPPWLTVFSPMSSMPTVSSAAISLMRESTLPRITPSLASIR